MVGVLRTPLLYVVLTFLGLWLTSVWVGATVLGPAFPGVWASSTAGALSVFALCGIVSCAILLPVSWIYTAVFCLTLTFYSAAYTAILAAHFPLWGSAPLAILQGMLAVYMGVRFAAGAPHMDWSSPTSPAPVWVAYRWLCAPRPIVDPQRRLAALLLFALEAVSLSAVTLCLPDICVPLFSCLLMYLCLGVGDRLTPDTSLPPYHPYYRQDLQHPDEIAADREVFDPHATDQIAGQTALDLLTTALIPTDRTDRVTAMAFPADPVRVVLDMSHTMLSSGMEYLSAMPISDTVAHVDLHHSLEDMVANPRVISAWMEADRMVILTDALAMDDPKTGQIHTLGRVFVGIFPTTPQMLVQPVLGHTHPYLSSRIPVLSGLAPIQRTLVELYAAGDFSGMLCTLLAFLETPDPEFPGLSDMLAQLPISE